MKDFYVSDDKNLLQIDVIHQFLAEEAYWSKAIPKEVIEKSIEGSKCFGVYKEREQVGFARVITDYATFAYLADVFILEQYRGKGLSKLLMKTILAHPELQGLRTWLLGTSDAHGLYRQFGFDALPEPKKYMRLGLKDNYLED